MSFHNFPVILPLLLSGAASGALGLYAWRHRHGRDGVTAFALMSFSLAVYALGDVLVYASTSLGWQYFWLRVRRPGLAFAPLLWLVFAAQYTGSGRVLTARVLVLLSIVPVANVLLSWTNEWHHLIWADVQATEWHGLHALRTIRGSLWLPASY